MLKDLGLEYVIIGHSERRALGETNEMINKKIMAALKNRLKPILCIDKISQIKKDLKGKIIIAYEPLFAIGTGKPCSIEKAKKMRRSLIRFKTVLYGGSVNSENAKDYIKKAGFQGLLVGGASLDAQEFIKIVKSIGA
jgi:triosephosphate isomerase